MLPYGVEDMEGRMRAIAVIETVSNQNFIFGTNRLREIVGASEMIYAAGVDLVLEACGYEKGDIEQARKKGGLANFKQSKDGEIDFLLVTSGKAILLGDEERLKNVIRKVTAEALARMPGITVRGAVADLSDKTPKRLHEAIREAHKRLADLRSRIPSNDVRFQRLPVVAECTSSGLPARGFDRFAPDEAMQVVSEPVRAKRRHRKTGLDRLSKWLPRLTADNIEELEKHLEGRDANWIAVVHADGNGLGEIFLDFLNKSGAKDFDDYIRKYRDFSLALEACTIMATERAISETWPEPENASKSGKKAEVRAPIIPLILGGDDLTVVCEGSRAVKFTEEFLRAFEGETGKAKGITEIAEEGLTACAGIAIVKPHFPFHRAYELAEELIKSAKKLGKKDPDKFCSALHYHVHFDSSGADWERISAQLDVPGKAHLSVQPWAVSCENAGVREIEKLWRGIAALKATDDDDEGRPRLPRSQQHALREALFAGRDIANARLKRIKHRYQDVKWGDILPSENKLFVEEDGQFITPLLDMMDLADLMDAADIRKLAEQNREEEQPA